MICYILFQCFNLYALPFPSSNLIPSAMKGMSLWSMVTISRNYQSILPWLGLFFNPKCCVIISSSVIVIFISFHCHTRSGEWGDHVTLQAAADSVLFHFLLCYLFFPQAISCWVCYIYLLFFILASVWFSDILTKVSHYSLVGMEIYSFCFWN